MLNKNEFILNSLIMVNIGLILVTILLYIPCYFTESN